MTETAISKKDKPTVGEELFLVHLKRCREEENDFEQMDGNASPRKRSNSTVGEELWSIHCRRSQGLEEDADRDEDQAMSQSMAKKVVATSTSKNHEAKVCVRYNLRSKDAPRKKA